MMNGGIPQAATPTPEEDKNPEYLKELQAEKDSLESAVVSSDEVSDEAAAANQQQRTNHAIKLLEQGKQSNLDHHHMSEPIPGSISCTRLPTMSIVHLDQITVVFMAFYL